MNRRSSAGGGVTNPDWLWRFHLGTETETGVGRTDIQRGGHWWAVLVGALLGLPRAGVAVPTRVRVVRAAAGAARGVDGSATGAAVERWERLFGRQSLSTCVVRRGDELCEQLGRLRLWMRLRVDATSMRITSEGAALSLCGRSVRLPRRLAPRTVAHAWSCDDDPGAAFDVEVRVVAPVVGVLLAYRGRIHEEDR
jgi:hypothetical protein